MSRDLPESDWKAFRKLREVALARFCERVLGEIGTIASTGATSYHDRYLKIYRLIDDRDEELARAFNDPRRSRAILELAAINSYGLLSDEELLSFTPGDPGGCGVTVQTSKERNWTQARLTLAAADRLEAPCHIL